MADYETIVLDPFVHPHCHSQFADYCHWRSLSANDRADLGSSTRFLAAGFSRAFIVGRKEKRQDEDSGRYCEKTFVSKVEKIPV